MIPSIYAAKDLATWSVSSCRPGGSYLPARPLGFDGAFWYNFYHRIKVAWKVFTGRYDALDWEDEWEESYPPIPKPLPRTPRPPGPRL